MFLICCSTIKKIFTMIQIKTLQFFIWHNGICNPQYREYMDKETPYSTPEEIDELVNETLKNICDDGSKILNITINDVTTMKHNNGGDDTIMRTYTILYEE